MTEHDIVVDPDGTLRFVYSDDLAALFDGEESRTRRVSHVEPFRNGWVADMAPVGGSLLFAGGEVAPDGRTREHLERSAMRVRPFPTRQAALDAERAYLREHFGL